MATREAPLGGVRQSGLGIRHGAEALRQFTRIQTIVEDRPLFGFVSAIVMRMVGFPYQRKVLELVRSVMRLRY